MQNRDERIQKGREIFEDVFEAIEYDTFYYKHYANPYALFEPLFFYEENGKIVGINAFDKVPFIVSGKEYSAVQSGDSAVLKEYRGKGIFTKIQVSALKYLEANQVNIEFGFPNEISYKGFMKLGWKSIEDFGRYVKILNLGNVLVEKTHIPLCKMLNKINMLKYRGCEQYVLEKYDKCPFKPIDIERINMSICTGVERSIDYYKWRIDNNCSNSYQYTVVQNHSEMKGYFIHSLNRRGKVTFAQVVDWYIDLELSLREQKKVMSVLLKNMKSECDIVSIPYVNTLKKEKEIIKKMHFIRRGKKPSLVIFNVLDGNERIINEIKSNMSIRGIDVDIIMN